LSYYPALDAPPVSAAPVSAYPPPVSYPPPGAYPPAAYPVPSPPPAASYYPPPTPPAYYPPVGYPGYAPGYQGMIAPMALAFDPVTGQPYSSKSKTTAGLLQLVLGLILALGGVGRLYAGHIPLGLTQLLLSIGAYLSLCSGAIGLLFVFAMWLWAWIDGLVMLTGRPVDGDGRLLRP
jgi:TM2 domain-containing membrane protein YozV